MSDYAKVTLSDSQLSMASNVDIILTKQTIIQKTSALFSALIPDIETYFKDIISIHSIPLSPPKITKGENYKNLPYVILDYPAAFGKQDIIALRTMFWWGNFISITIHLSGGYKKLFEEAILKNAHQINELYICINTDPWANHFEEDNYVKLKNCDAEILKQLSQKAFLKVALKYKLHQFNLMQQLLPEGYMSLANLLKP